MKPRTPGFTPARLTLAREAAGLSKADLSIQLGVSAAAIGQYENGTRTPGPDIVKAMSKYLGQPLAFFTRPAPPKFTSPVFYRSLRSTEEEARLKAKAKLTYLWETLDYVLEIVTLPSLDMPKVGRFPERPQEITNDMIEMAAQTARQHWNMGDLPAPNIVWLLEQSGAIVLRVDLANDRMDALSYWRAEDGRPYILLNDTKRNAFRSRADIAHELGHLLLHRYIKPQYLDDRESFKLIEEQAWQFAQSFLLPERSFLKDVYSLSLDVLLALKPRWKVSVAFMLQRIFNLGIIANDKYSNYRKYMARRDWLRGEPYDAETAPEKPMLLRQLMEHLRDNRIQSPEQLLSALNINPIELEEITQVDTGFFSALVRPNIIFTPKRRVD